MIAFSTEPDDLHQTPAVSCTEALVETFADELRARLAPARIIVAVDYASLLDTPHHPSDGALRSHVVALAGAFAAHVRHRSEVVVHLSFSGVRTSGSVHLEVTLEHGQLLADGLADELAAHSSAVLECDPHRATLAFYPQLIAATSESIPPYR